LNPLLDKPALQIAADTVQHLKLEMVELDPMLAA